MLKIHGSSLSVTCVPYMVMIVGAGLRSRSDDRLIAKGLSQDVRRDSVIFGFLFASFFMFLLAAGATHATVAIMALSLSLTGNAVAPIGYEAAKLDVVAPRFAGRFQGISNTLASFSAIIGIPLVAGVCVSSTL